MTLQPSTEPALRAELAELRARLEEAEETLRAIRTGEVDALVVEGDAGLKLFTLQGLDAEQNRFRGEMLEQVSDAVIAVDTEERVTFLNASAESQYGVRSGDVLGRKLTEIFTQHWPRPEAEAERQTVLHERREWRGELIQHTHDGRELHVETVNTALRGPDGAATGYVMAIRDIRERKQAEKELYEQRRLYKSVTDNASVSLFIMDERQQCSFMNPAAEELTGFTLDEVRGKALHEVIHHTRPDGSHYPLCECPIDQAFPQNDREQGEEVFVHKDGHFYHVAFTASPIRDRQGKPAGTVIEVDDITERKRAEETVTRLAAIVESSHDALFSEDREGIVTSWNRGAEQIFGYRADEIIGTSIMRLIPEARQEEEHEMQRNIAVGQRGGTFETIRQAKDGREFHASITVSPLKDAAGKIIGSSRVVRDITERKAAEEALQANEERMRLATAATGVGIWEWNLITGFIRWDAQMFRIYGVAPTTDGLVTYETWRRALLPEDLVLQEEVLAETVRRLGNSTRDFRIVRADNGECRWIQAVETVRTNEEGKAEWVVGTNLDVTARTNAERAVREEAQRKDEFLAMLGHELRNPLNAIRHAVQIGVEAPENRVACQAAAKVIDRQSKQLSRMVDDLLDVARINRGRVELRVEALDLGPVLEQAIAAVRPLFDGRGQTFTSDIGSQLRVNGDAPRLEQVFVNLLTNAAKYTPGNGRISLHARHQEGEVVVTITDSGAGIPPELLPRIFDLFRQADSTLDRALGGLGIGLNVVKSLVEMHFGRVTVESAGTNAGTTATVRLPSLLEWPAAGSAPAAPPITAAPQKPVRVLIVDDHIDAAETLKLLLQLRGCEARCANSGPAGVAAAREFRPEVLLLDLGLPGLDGYEVARILRAEAPFADALFIAISGYAQDSDRQRCLASGFDDHFPKPFDLSKLLQVIHSRPYQEHGTHGHFPPCAPVEGPP